MGWKCGECGQENKSDGPKMCEACGHVEWGLLTLKGDSGKELEFRLASTFGRSLWKTLSADAENLVSDSQFHLSRDDSFKSWCVIQCKGTPNVTTVNGSPCPDGTPIPLKAGDAIAIGSRKSAGVEKARLSVDIKYS